MTQSLPMLDTTALGSVRRWRFTPAMRDGHAVPVRMIIVMNF